MNEYLARTLNNERMRKTVNESWREYCRDECDMERVHHPRSAD